MDGARVGKRLDERELPHREPHGLDLGRDRSRAPRERDVRYELAPVGSDAGSP